MMNKASQNEAGKGLVATGKVKQMKAEMGIESDPICTHLANKSVTELLEGLKRSQFEFIAYQEEVHREIAN